MKKIMNEPQNFVDEVMVGIELAYGDRVRLLDGDKRILVSAYPRKKGKVGIVTAGGSGHLPVFLGYVGSGLLDGCAVGNVFASPSAKKMAAMITACDDGNGVLCLYGNYGGDKMNFAMACEMVEMDDIETMSVLVTDDVASSPRETAEKRRGVAGMVFAFKVAGAAADEMMSLEEVVAVTKKAVSNIRTMGVALSPCIVPEVGKPTFTIEDDELELGMGIHGERGIEVCKMLTANEIADFIFEKIVNDMPLAKGSEVAVMVNGLGATPLEEQILVYSRVASRLKEQGVSVFMPHIGEFATSMEMAGLSITIMKLDEQLKALLRKPASSPFYTSENK
ncbi:dihydroxyacetone kinase [Sphaerochaeta pleomorpha str. Grapes]|uniref:Dihydroxyacetone kinase n=1 Tax=Sphaerochaeta pleomorpha (strain ATCC BAA-1885 / DSM 22778 / Grapes) TaxID=158190 RepID=G8QXH2_SPHPG|nr:dihydroxyacetone kinase subunit DhaK [Sphaerochaeta pleomorpha]AEV29535.1 dihydroxyacetone kinase [Sphaerochaeta pleomorpha str. Grapes]